MNAIRFLSRFSFYALALLVLAPAASAQLKKVVLTQPPGAHAGLSDMELSELQRLIPGVRIVAPARDRLHQELADADAVIGRINPEQFQAAPNLKWVQSPSAGVEGVLFPEMVASDVVLTNTKILQGPQIADHAFALLLGLTRGIPVAAEMRETGEWRGHDFGNLIELDGKTAVVVGVGGIGTQVAVRAKAFGMRVIGVDPKDLPYTPYLDRTVPPDRLDHVLPEADVVFICAPFTPETDRMFDTRRFGLMKQGSLFIAVSRGGIFDGEALMAALDSGRLAGAGLDVTNPEPLPVDHPLWKYRNVIITPHIATHSDGKAGRFFETFRENLIRFANDEPLLNVVDKELGY